MIYKSNGKTFFVENRLYQQMSRFTVEEMKRKDNNKIFIVCGDTGIGKSAFTFQLASVIDGNFGLKNIQFTTEQMKEALQTMKNQVVIFDEAFRGMSGRNVMGKAQKELLGMLYEIRQLNQVVFLVAPSFFRLDEAIAVELSDALFHIHKTGKGVRAFRMFNRKKKDRLYYYAKRGKKTYNLVPSMFNGIFPDNYVVDGEDYREKKFSSLHAPTSPLLLNKTEEILRDKETKLCAALVKQMGSYRKASKYMEQFGLDMKRSTLHEKIAQNPEIHAIVRPK